jgi:hypothetical protein
MRVIPLQQKHTRHRVLPYSRSPTFLLLTLQPMAHFTESRVESNRIDNGSKEVAKVGSKIHATEFSSFGIKRTDQAYAKK